MDPKRYQRLKDLVDQALELPEMERDLFLQDNCEDNELLAEARDLLLHFRSDTGETSTDIPLPTDLPEMVGKIIGPYQIIKPLGEGGMGIVYLAGQSAPLRRKVALKVIKLGMDTREVITRFESERQALALMDHPNIAKVFDAGATDSGRPFFVMEYIPGVPLNKYCEEHQVGLRERLGLFIQVCSGVQHAHQKGIIHRDLKPGNILVTETEGSPVPKIIDFGVAKATSQHLTVQTLFTQMGQMIGTPEYMSPEQAGSSNSDVDTRSDVYSLGVLLYELLTGVLPLERRDIMQAGFDRMALHVQNEIPKKPSTRIDTEARQPTTSTSLQGRETRRWVKRIRGDLDWITMKALEKDRDRRYWSPASLAEELERHLNNLPVEAGPPSGLYRISKFVKRNKATVAFISIAFLALVGFAAWQTVQSRIISRERDLAMANERLSHARGQVEKDPTVAVAYALSSLEVLDQPAVRDVVRQALVRTPIRNELPSWGQSGNPISVDASPDGKLCAVSWSQTKFPTVGIYDLRDYSQRIFKAPTEGIVYGVFFNSDGSHVAGWSTNGLHLWRVADGKYLHRLEFINDFDSSFVYRLKNPLKLAVSANQIGEPTTWFEVDVFDGSVRELGRSRGAQTSESPHFPAIDAGANRILDYDERSIYLQRYADLDTDRAILLGHHESPIASVALDAFCETGASVDIQGQVKVWDLTVTPPELLREYHESPGRHFLAFDPFGNRFFSTWGSATAKIYDLDETPFRSPVSLLDRTHWTHHGTFLPDRSLITSRNAIEFGPVAHWNTGGPVVWDLDLNVVQGAVPIPRLSEDGSVLYLWTRSGEVLGVPVAQRARWPIGSIGCTRGWNDLSIYSFLVDAEKERCVTFSEGTQLLDFRTGVGKDLPGVERHLLPWAMNEDGRYLCFGDLNEPAKLPVYDLDAQRFVSVIDIGEGEPEGVSFGRETAILVLQAEHLTRHELLNPAADPDTLWRGDASGGGDIFEAGRILVVRDSDLNVFWVDVASKNEKKLFTTPNSYQMFGLAYHHGLGLVAIGGMWDTIDLFNVHDGQNWSLPFPAEEKKLTAGLEFDPHGRWLLSWTSNGITAWKLLPDPVFGEMEYEDLVGFLRNLTNVRIVPDETKPNGFRITNTLEMGP